MCARCGEMVVSKVWGSCRLGRVMGDGEAVERKREKRSSNWEQKVFGSYQCSGPRVGHCKIRWFFFIFVRFSSLSSSLDVV